MVSFDMLYSPLVKLFLHNIQLELTKSWLVVKDGLLCHSLMLLVVVSDINQKSFLFLPVPHLKIKYTFYFSNYNSRLLLMPLLRRKSGIIIGVVSIPSTITKWHYNRGGLYPFCNNKVAL